MSNEPSQSGRTAGSDERGQLGRLMQRRVRTLDVLTRGKTRAGYRVGIVKSLITAGALGHKLREHPSGPREFDDRRDRLSGLITPTGKRRALPTNKLDRIAPNGNFSAGRAFKSAWENRLRRVGSSSEAMRAKSGDAIDTANGRLANQVDGYHAAGAVSAGAHAKLAEVIAGGAGSLGAGRKAESSAARLERTTFDPRKLDYQVRGRRGISGSRKAPALLTVGGPRAIDRRSLPYGAADEFGRTASASMLRNSSSRWFMREGLGRGSGWNGYPNGPRPFRSAGEGSGENRRSNSPGRGTYADARPGASARYAERQAGRRQPALTVNFSPTVVLEGVPDQVGKLNIVEALGRHSHELVLLIEREIAKQRRVEF